MPSGYEEGKSSTKLLAVEAASRRLVCDMESKRQDAASTNYERIRFATSRLTGW
ncbi:hypothetical protein VN12_08030 [Pirellula sp. SH-Sr6A]|nr:hypothetical protein VN12_08030 [Pirellula sp. SH-Sr6A]